MGKIFSSHIFYCLLLLFIGSNLFAQKQLSENNWIKVLSGDVETYKSLNIKTIQIKKNEEVLKEMEFLPTENKLKIINGKQEATYFFNKDNTIQKVDFANRSHEFTYENNRIRSYKIIFKNDETLETRIIDRPYFPDFTEWYTEAETKISDGKLIKSSSIKTVLNPADSLFGYREVKIDGHYRRTYFNKTKTGFTRHAANNFTYDSLYTNNNGVLIRYNEVIDGTSKVRTITQNDSIGEFYLENNQIYHIKLSTAQGLIKEIKYDKIDGTLIETSEYFYYPKENSTSIAAGKILQYDAKTRESSIIYPLHQWYKIKNNVLVKRKRFNFWKKKRMAEGSISMGSCAAYSIKKYRPSYIYDISSTSIIIDVNSLENNVDTYIVGEALEDDEVYQTFIHSEIPVADRTKANYFGMYKKEVISKEIKRENGRLAVNILRKKEAMKELKIEITTYDHEKYVAQPLDYFEKLNLNFDYFIFVDDMKSYLYFDPL